MRGANVTGMYACLYHAYISVLYYAFLSVLYLYSVSPIPPLRGLAVSVLAVPDRSLSSLAPSF